MPRVEQEHLASALTVNLVSEPSKYLGLNFKLKGKRVVDFHYLVDKLSSKLQGWKAKLLSQASRTTLIHSALQSMPLYAFTCFRVPESICNKLDAITRSFWWGHDQGVRKLHLLNWNRVCVNPRNREGLGLKKFNLMNQAMLAKQFWRIHQNPQSLLARTFKAKYFPRNSIHECQPKPHQSWFWRNIVNRIQKVERGGSGGLVMVQIFL
ncbi:putative mitochondrial protein [Quercus suber]|uniref:Mitochondrial protein n=1 Tax=Quercus suber TaxID=58331 RepID=A0AAW0IP81_QUESU